jgi:hypothetical protein
MDSAFLLKFSQHSVSYYSIESAKYNGKYLRTTDQQLKVVSNKGETNFYRDVSHRLVNGEYMG